jgi:universal stress protein A
MKNILVPTDLSKPSLKAVDYAHQLADATGGKITLLHVVEPVVLPDAAALLTLPDDHLNEKMRGKLDALKRAHNLPDATVVVRKGTPFHEIALAATELKADLIVIATHGYTGLKHVLLGSTAERVVRHAHCPVLVVPARD